MSRYGISFDYIEENWTLSQYVAVFAAIRENEKLKARGKKRGMNAAQYAGRFTR
jgi:hypothetical protein